MSTTYAEYMEAARALRHDPMVQAWIDARSGKEADCSNCSFPHGKHFLCNGGVFGELQLGRDTYYVSLSNVVFFVEFMREHAPEGAHHWRYDRFFLSQPDSIEVTYFTSYNNTPQKNVWHIPRNEWDTIVSQMARPEASAHQPAKDQT